MRILTKYIVKTVITYTFLVVLLLLGLHAFLEFMHEFSDLGSGNYGLLQVMQYVPMMLPGDIYQFFPMAGLLGTIIGLGLLASTSELVAMRSAGLSMWNVSFSVLQAAIILIVIMIILGEIISPFAQRFAIEKKSIAISGGQTLVTKHGIWQRNGDNYVHINKIASNGSLEGVTRYYFAAKNKLALASYAKSAVFVNKQWIFKNVTQTTFLPNSTTSAYLPQQEWGFKINPKLLGLTSVDTDQKTLPELRSYIKYRYQSGLGSHFYEFIFWQRLFQPLATLVMIILAVPFVFGPFRSASMGLRMLAGVMVGFGFYILNQFAGPMSTVLQFSPAIAAILPTLVFVCIGGVLCVKLSR